MSGERGSEMAVADKIVAMLGLKLEVAKRPRTKRRPMDEPITRVVVSHPDITVKHQGGEAWVRYLSKAGEEWLASNIIPGSRPFVGGPMVDSKYVAKMIKAMKRDGLDVSTGD